MAGRGTDIKINEEVKRGRLAIIGTERHESKGSIVSFVGDPEGKVIRDQASFCVVRRQSDEIVQFRPYNGNHG